MTRRKSSEQDTEAESTGTDAKLVAGTKVAETGKEVSTAIVAGQPEAGDSPPVKSEQMDIGAIGQPAPAKKQREVAEPAPTETPPAGVHLKTLAQNLYQMGVDLGLAPDEAALLTSETKLPAFIGEEGAEEFKQGLVEAYREMLDERLQNLKQKLGVG